MAAAAAAVLLVTVVLPANTVWIPRESAGLLGLTEMGEIKMPLAEEAAAAEAAEAAAASAPVPAAAPPFTGRGDGASG